MATYFKITQLGTLKIAGKQFEHFAKITKM